MEKLLQGIPHAIVRVDDILIIGKDYANHLKNLETAFKKLAIAGLRLQKEKCKFLQP